MQPPVTKALYTAATITHSPAKRERCTAFEITVFCRVPCRSL